jgi:hypothetical protein
VTPQGRSGRLQKVKDELNDVLLEFYPNQPIPTGNLLGTTPSASGEPVMRNVLAFFLTDVIVVADCPRWDEESGELYWVYKGEVLRQDTHMVVPVSEDVNRVLYHLRRDLAAQKPGRDWVTISEVNKKAEWLWNQPSNASC